MSRCNLFKRLSNQTGEFMMFSQFPEDIAKGSTDGVSYRVVPSKFAALNLNFDKGGLDDLFPQTTSTITSDNTYNNALPRAFQCYFENSIAAIKDNLTASGKDWNPEYANNILWRTLEKYKLINPYQNTVASSNTYNEWWYPELMYVGDIPFYSNRDKDNISYNEIYCYIPIDEHRRYYYLESGLGTAVSYNAFDAQHDNTYIRGWNSNNYPSNDSVNPMPVTDTNDQYVLIAASSDSVIGRIPQILYNNTYTNPTSEDLDPEDDPQWSSYQFNTIIVFYDVYNNIDAENPVAIYKNIPLGIYFTGPFTETVTNTTTTHTMNNPVTKYVSNAAAFGQGSAYGLRIMTRFVPTPNSTSYWTETTTGEDVAALATMMGELGDTLSEIRTAMSSTNSISQDIKDHLAMFKNYRVNVPYLRTVDGRPTWFVNGRNTGVAADIPGISALVTALAAI